MCAILHGFLFGRHLAGCQTCSKGDFVDVGNVLVVATYSRLVATRMIRSFQDIYAPTQETEISF